MSVKSTTAIVVQSPKEAPKMPPVEKPAEVTTPLAEFFNARKVQQLSTDTLAEPQTTPTPAASQQIEKQFQVQRWLQDTATSTLDKLKKLIPIPASLLPLIDVFLSKKSQYNVNVGIKDDCLTLGTTINMASEGIQGSAVLELPLTEQETTDQDSLVKMHPDILDMLHKAVEKQENMNAILKILLMVPAQNIDFKWSDGVAIIKVGLANDARLVLNLKFPSQAESSQTPDFLRVFLKSILKQNYAGIETLLNKDVKFTWNGATSQFNIEFPDHFALRINKLENLSADLPSVLNELIAKLGSNTIIIPPKNIRGTIDFKNPSIQFEKGTTFEVKDAPIPDITLDRISWDPTKQKAFLTLKTSWTLFPDFLLQNIEIDLKEDPSKPKKTDEKPTLFDFECITCEKTAPKTAAPEQTQLTVVAARPMVSAFETVKKLIQIPAQFLPLVGTLFANENQLDVKVGIENDLKFAGEVKLPHLGISGHAQISIPTAAGSADPMPVKLHPKIDAALAKLIAQEAMEVTLINTLIDAVLTLPNQDISIDWQGDHATVITTLPGGVTLKLELDVQKRQAENDQLRTEILAAVDVTSSDNTELVRIINTVGENDFRHDQLLKVVETTTDKAALKVELLKVLERDILRTKLVEVLGDQFPNLAPLLTQTFSFKWNSEMKRFSINFLEQQEIKIKSLKLKKGGLLQNILRKIVGWFSKNRSITIPKQIVGTVDFEKGTITFKKGSAFVLNGPWGLSKKVSIRTVALQDDGKIDLGLRFFFRTWHKLNDPKTSSVDTAIMAIHPRGSLRDLE